MRAILSKTAGKTLGHILRFQDRLLLNKRREYIKSTSNPLVRDGVKILNKDLSIEYIINNKVNLARFGDLEFNIIGNRKREKLRKGYQSINSLLAKKLKVVLNTEVDRLRIAIPYSLINADENTPESATFWYKYVLSDSEFLSSILPKHIEYLDASLTRIYIPIMDQEIAMRRFQKMKTLWDNRDILFVEGSLSRNAIGDDLFSNARSISRIICPSKNAFERYDDILNSIKKYGKDKLVIGCLGPTACILSHDLANTDIWFLDMGHIDLEYVWCKNKEGRIPIKGRLLNEGGFKNQDLELDEATASVYKKSIIEVIE